MPTLSGYAQCFEVSIKAVPHLALCRVGKMSAVVEKTREFLCKNAPFKSFVVPAASKETEANPDVPRGHNISAQGKATRALPRIFDIR
jgi:hypothetical protein